MTARDIIRGTAQVYDVSAADLLGTSRHALIVRARHVAMWLVRDLLKASYPETAKALNRGDHTTAMSATKALGRLMQIDDELRTIVEHARRSAVAHEATRRMRDTATCPTCGQCVLP